MLSGKQPAARTGFVPRMPRIGQTGAIEFSVNSVAFLARALHFLLPDLEAGNKVD
jgi:hypothetical protein